MEFVAKSWHIGRHDSKIFGDERESGRFLPHCLEEVRARPRHPFTSPSCSRACRYVPGGGEPPAVIETNQVHVGQQGADSIYTPSIAGGAEDSPVVAWIAPQLPLCTEMVGGHPDDEPRPTIFVQ